MNLQQGEVPFSTDLLSSTKAAMEAWLRSPDIKAQTDAFIAAGEGNEEQQKVLACFTRTFGCYQMSDQDAVRLLVYHVLVSTTLFAHGMRSSVCGAMLDVLQQQSMITQRVY